MRGVGVLITGGRGRLGEVKAVIVTGSFSYFVKVGKSDSSMRSGPQPSQGDTGATISPCLGFHCPAALLSAARTRSTVGRSLGSILQQDVDSCHISMV